MNTIKRLALGLFLTCVSGLAFAQMWQGFPLVGFGSYCAAYTNAVCTSTIPAGPTVITGNETILADTNLTQGQRPSTVLLKSANLGAGPYQYNAPLTGASITVLPTSRRLILEPAGTIAALTVTLPASTLLVDNQTFGLCSTQVVTALTMTAGSGTTLLNPITATIVPVATGAANCGEWVYRLSNTSWYRVQ